MALPATAALRQDNDESSAGGPIGALLIAVPVSILLMGAAVWLLLNLVH